LWLLCHLFTAMWACHGHGDPHARQMRWLADRDTTGGGRPGCSVLRSEAAYKVTGDLEEEGAEPANSNRPEQRPAGQVRLMPRANLPVPCLSFQAKHVNFPWGHQHPAAVKSFAILPP
jgi:hypothetical protein